MVKVDKLGINNTQSVNNIDKVKVSKKAIHESFKNKLDNIRQEQIREVLKILYDKIEAQSAKLKDSLFIDDLVEYKRLVKEFLNVTVNNSHVFYKENSLDRRGRHRVYSLVKRVDNELDELTKDFLNVENNRLKILRRLDDIKGLLLDILT
ncbi:MAG: YaaR family protein [Tissierellia bacterium]|nr:YaaR family protein [Tissierellia bacterium]